MKLTHDAMLVSLRISAWSGRQYDHKASNQVAIHHDASANAGRYNKRLLPKSAFATITATMSAARTDHYANTLPWDDQGNRLLPVANYDHYTALFDQYRETIIRNRTRFIEDYDLNIAQAQLELGRLYNPDEYPTKEALQANSTSNTGFYPSPTPTISSPSLLSTTPSALSSTSNHRFRNAWAKRSPISITVSPNPWNTSASV